MLLAAVIGAICSYTVMLVLSAPLAYFAASLRLGTQRYADTDSFQHAQVKWARAAIWGVPAMLLVRALLGILSGMLWPIHG